MTSNRTPHLAAEVRRAHAEAKAAASSECEHEAGKAHLGLHYTGGHMRRGSFALEGLLARRRPRRRARPLRVVLHIPGGLCHPKQDVVWRIAA